MADKDKEQRLAKQLRANLKKRKLQARARDAEAQDEKRRSRTEDLAKTPPSDQDPASSSQEGDDLEQNSDQSS